MLVFNCSQIDTATISIPNEHVNRHNQSLSRTSANLPLEKSVSVQLSADKTTKNPARRHELEAKWSNSAYLSKTCRLPNEGYTAVNHTTYSLTFKQVCLFSFLFTAEGNISA
jgi:hypothetical protein